MWATTSLKGMRLKADRRIVSAATGRHKVSKSMGTNMNKFIAKGDSPQFQQTVFDQNSNFLRTLTQIDMRSNKTSYLFKMGSILCVYALIAKKKKD